MQSFFLKTGRQQYEKIYLKDIFYIEGSKGYTKLVTGKKTYTVLLSMCKWLDKLPEGSFMKVHQSYIVSTDKVTLIEWDSIHLGEICLPLSRKLRVPLIQKLNIIQPEYSMHEEAEMA